MDSGWYWFFKSTKKDFDVVVQCSFCKRQSKQLTKKVSEWVNANESLRKRAQKKLPERDYVVVVGAPENLWKNNSSSWSGNLCTDKNLLHSNLNCSMSKITKWLIQVRKKVKSEWFGFFFPTKEVRFGLDFLQLSVFHLATRIVVSGFVSQLAFDRGKTSLSVISANFVP